MKYTCKQCGKEFELSQSEIDFYNSKNLHLPKRCQECRQANKQKKGGNVRNYRSTDMQNKYHELSNDRNSAGNRSLSNQFVYAVLIIALLLTVGGVALTRINFTDEYAGSEESQYSENAYIPQTVHSESEFSTDTVQDELVASDDAVQSGAVGSGNSTELVQSGTEASGASTEAFQAEPETSTEAVQGEAEEPVNQEQENVSTAKQYYFRNDKLLNEHFQKHGIEMGFSTKEEYQAAASAVVNNENALHKYEKEDGDDVYYLEASNDFVIVSTDGYIRTYYKPNDGIEYFNRQ